MERTLIFCTSYAETQTLWSNRYRVWVDAIEKSLLDHDHILILDDSSPVLPDWENIPISHPKENKDINSNVSILQFQKNLGRQARSVYPGWYRSFCYGAIFAKKHNFSKVIHIESDGFIISNSMQHYINDLRDGWVAPAIQSHRMPESAIQIIAGNSLSSYHQFAERPYGEVVGFEAENIIPFTRIEDKFVGSRYGETMNYVPREADFVTQTNPSMLGKPEYYWWLK